MNKEIIRTGDGSHTISVPEMKVTYHSVHGAVRESMHVFIEAGLRFVLDKNKGKEIHVFEMGFGTGLNAFLSAIVAQESGTNITYSAIEKNPLSDDELQTLNYSQVLGYAEVFSEIHGSKWEERVQINDNFSLHKIQTELSSFSTTENFDVVYYDAFAPSAQPELWTKELFEKLYSLLSPSGVLVTYCSKGDVRRAMIAAGFNVKKLPGPPGKREMLRGEKG